MHAKFLQVNFTCMYTFLQIKINVNTNQITCLYTYINMFMQMQCKCINKKIHIYTH